MQITRKHLIGTLAATSLIAGAAVPVLAHVDDHRCGYVHRHGESGGQRDVRSGDRCGADGHDQEGSDDPDPPTGLAAGVAAEVPGQVHRVPDLAGHRSADPRSDDHLQRVALRDGVGSLHVGHRQHRTSGPGGRDPGSGYRFSGSPEDMIQTPER